MNRTLEVVFVPVADVERAEAFYSNEPGFAPDHAGALRARDAMRP